MSRQLTLYETLICEQLVYYFNNFFFSFQDDCALKPGDVLSFVERTFIRRIIVTVTKTVRLKEKQRCESVIYQLLHQCHIILAACNSLGERACEFFLNIAQNQHSYIYISGTFLPYSA